MKMTHLIETSTDAIIALRPNMTVEFMNRAVTTLLGFSTIEAQGSQPQQLWLPREAVTQFEYDLRLVASGKSVAPFKAVWRHRDGSPVEVFVALSAIRDQDGNFLGTSQIIRDLSMCHRQWELQVKLLESACLGKTDRYVATIAHEINQPLAIIDLMAEAIEEGTINIRQAAKQISEQVLRATAIIRRTRNDANDRRRKSIDINELIRESVNSVLMALAPTDVETIFELHDIPPIMVDNVQMTQVLVNLVRNALEAMQQKGGRLLVKSQRNDDTVSITVADDGPGISPDVWGKLFEPYVTTKPNGLGIGLALSQEIVRAHAGELSIHTNGNTGACFVVNLPIKSIGA